MQRKLDINGKVIQVDAPDDMPLLWVLREKLNLTGTKFGCGAAQCGACMVHIDGQAAPACQTPVSALDGMKIVTIEGVPATHPVRRAWVDNDVPQCGYCQSGQIMSAIALLNSTPNPGAGEVDDAMSRNICRCGTYNRIRAAIADAAKAGPMPAKSPASS